MIVSFQVRRATRTDLPALVKFNLAMAQETEQRSLDVHKLRKGVQAVFDDESKGTYYVLEYEGSVRAALMITSEWSDWRNGMFWWIQSVYVEPHYRRRGMYKTLYEKIKTLSPEHIVGFRLYVDKNNLSGQKTYENLGMYKISYDMYEELIE